MARFIAVEGLDGAGTTTQVARLVARLEQAGHPTHQTFEPSDLPIGRMVRSVLRQETGAPGRPVLPWLFAADRSDHLDREVQPALTDGKHVVTDRYVPSSLAYQALEVDMDIVWSLNAHFRAPDLTVFVHVPFELGLERIGARGTEREVYEKRDLLERVAANYERALARLEARGDRIERIDGTASIEDVHEAIWAHTAPLVGI